MHIKENKNLSKSRMYLSDIFARTILRFLDIVLISLISRIQVSALPYLAYIIARDVYRYINTYKKVEIESSTIYIYIYEVSDGMNMKDMLAYLYKCYTCACIKKNLASFTRRVSCDET